MTHGRRTTGRDDDWAIAIEYTDLRKTISARDVETMCLEATGYGLGAVVVPSALVREAAGLLADERCAVGTVISYPFGTQSPAVKAREAGAALEHGAAELDVVPHFGPILGGRWDAVRDELRELRRATGDARLKLVLEVDRMSNDVVREACAIAAGEGFRFVVNTMGFRIVSTDPDAEGAASPDAIRLLRKLANDELRLKAVGGIVGREQIDALIAAGADRIAIEVASGVLRGILASFEEGDVR